MSGLAGRRTKRSGERGSSAAKQRIFDSGSDLVSLVVDYAKQETLEPVKSLGRFLLWGVAGSVALSIGLVLLLVALLRVVQEETGSTFRGNLSWLPYVVTAAAAVAVVGLAGWRITKGPAKRRSGTGERSRS